MAKLYTLKRRKDTNEYHLFESVMEGGDCYVRVSESICQMMQKSEGFGNAFACKDEYDTRVLCAEKGRQVCGVCVSTLYTTYKNN